MAGSQLCTTALGSGADIIWVVFVVSALAVDGAPLAGPLVERVRTGKEA